MNGKHIDLIVQQCTNQQVLDRPDAIARFAVAYEQARLSTSVPTLDQIMAWAELIEPVNAKGFRCVPVRFGWHSQGMRPDMIERALQSWYEAYRSYLLTGEQCFGENRDGITVDQHTEFYRTFEEIHPFEDGNGRLGHLLWAISHMFQGNGWPMNLPPDLWRTDK